MKDFSNKTFKRAEELRDLLNKANKAYYVLDEPILKDTVYDSLYRELLDIEKEYPSLITNSSPSQNLGGIANKRFSNIKHRISLLSLDNAFNLKEAKSWFLKTQSSISEELKELYKNSSLTMVGELKIDGNAIALSYKNGILVKAATRGDGNQGEDITANVKTISSIPLSLKLKKPPDWMEVRGEAFIPDENFEKINERRKLNGDNLFANPRNACAGTLRQIDSKVVASRGLDFFAYTLHLSEDWVGKENILSPAKTQWEGLELLKKLGFKVNTFSSLIYNFEELKSFFEYWEEKRHELPYQTDGLVIKINNYAIQEQLGFTQKAPRWAIAIKYPAEELPTKLKQLTFQVGRTGVITPIAEFEVIKLAGTRVSRATLHNADRIRKLDLHSGDTIVVRKAGEIIPEVRKVLLELRLPNAKPLDLPSTCPECFSQLNRTKDQAATRCINNSCQAILRGVLKHWVSQNALDIDGCGSKLIDQLVEQNLVKSIADLYKLNIECLSRLERMGDKSARNILSALEDSKKQPWYKQLYGLGIQHVGESNAKALAQAFPAVSELKYNAENNQHLITKIFGIGDEIAQSLKEWFSNLNNQKLLTDLNKVGFTLSNKEEEKITDTELQLNKSLAGQTFVITGTLTSFTRKEAANMIEKHGGKVTSSLSTKTSFLVSGANSGTKLNKAQEIGVKIIDEKQLKVFLS